MQNAIWKTVVRTALTLGLVAAGSTTQVARAQNNAAGPIIGTWDVTLTVRNCATGQALATIRELATFSRGGTLVTSTAGVPPAAKTPGHGVWRHLTDHTYAYCFKFFRFDGAGALTGWSIVSQEALVNAGGDDYTSEGGIVIYNTAGDEVGRGCSTISATRFE
jgi:hypothetical protein